MSGSVYYSRFVFTSTGLSGILSEFKSVAAQIDAQAATLGKMNFTGMNAALPVLKNIDNTLLLMAQHANLLSSSGSKLGNVFTPMSAGATKASTATKSVATSMTQLQAISGQVTSSTTKATSSMSALGSAGKAALGGVVSAGERAIATMSALSAATMSVGRSMARMGTLAAIPMAGMKGLSGAVTGSLLASSAAMLLNPFNAAPLVAGYGAYTGMNIEKWASEAAAKSWKPGMTKADSDLIKQYTQQLARSQVGTSVYSPTDLAKAIAEYAGMGGNVTPGTPNTLTKSMLKGFSQYAQAINSEDIGTSLNTLVSQNLTWFGLKKAFVEENLKYTENLMASLVATTKAKDTDLAPLLKDVSAVAKTYGRTQTETYAMTASLYQLGLQPQQAGMAYRRILLRGTPNVSDLNKQEAYNMGITNEKGQIIDEETGKAVTLSYVNQALDKLGLTWKDINPETYGEMGSLGVIDKINKAFDQKGYSDIERQAWAKTVYGLQGSTPFAMLGQNPELAMEYFKIFTDSQKGLGAATEMSAIQVDNLEGSLKFLKTSLQGTAAGISDYVNPSFRKFSDFLTTTAVPGLNALGGALAAGDWEGVADIAGSALDFIGEKFASSDDTLTSWINNGIDGLDEFSQRFVDFTSGGGVGDLLGGLGEWAQNIWDGIDWGQVGSITSNLSTAFNVAWDQSMAWLSSSIDNVDWSNLGTRAGEALQDAGLWILNKIGDLPWSELTTAATNALTGILLTIDWGSAVSTAISVGGKIGSAIYSGISSANLGILFQNWAIQFQNSMGMAIASVAASLAGLAAQMGVPVASVQGFVDASIQEGKSILETGEKIASVISDPSKETGPYSYIHTTSYQPSGEESSILKKYYNFAIGDSWDAKTGEKNPGIFDPVIDYVNSFLNTSDVPVLAGSKNQQRIAEKFGVDINTARVIEPYANLRAENGLYRTTFNGIGGVSVDEGVSGSEALGQFKRDLPAIQWLQKSIMEAKTPAKAYVDGIYTCANFVDDTIKEIQSAEDSDFAEAIYSKNVEAIQQQALEQLWSHRLGMAIVPYNSDISHAQIGFNPSSETSAEDVNLFEVTQGNTRGYKGQVRSIVADKSQAQDYAEFFTKYYMSETQPMFNGLMSEYYRYVPEDEKNRLINGEGAVVGNQALASDITNNLVKGNFLNNRVEVAGVGGTEEKSYAGIESSTPVGQASVNKVYKATKGYSDDGTITSKATKVSDDNNNDNDRKSQSSLSKIEDNTKQMYTLLEGVNAQGQSITPRWYKTPEDAEIGRVNLEKLGYEVKSKLVPAPNIVDQNIKTIGKQTTATSSLTGETTGLTGEVSSLSSATSSLTGEFAVFADLINSGDYTGISQLIKDKYAFDNPATKEDERLGVWTAEDWASIDTKTKDKSDIDAALSTYLSILKATQNPYIAPEIKKATEDTAKHTKKLENWSDPWAQFKTIKDAFSDSSYETTKAVQSTTSAVQSESDRAETQAKVDESLQQLLYSTICDIEGFFTPERVSPLGSFVSPTGGKLVRVADTWMTKDEYEATIGVSVVDQQMAAAALVGKVPYAGTITAADTPRILEYLKTLTPEAMERAVVAWNKNQKITPEDFHIPEEYKRDVNWGIMVGGEARKPQMKSVLLGSLANGNVEVPVEPVVNTEPIDTLKSTTDAGLPYDVKVTSNADAVAAQLVALGGSTTFTVYVNTVNGGSGQVTDFAEGTSTLSDGSIFSFDAFKNVTDAFENAINSFKEASSDITDVTDIGLSTDPFPDTSEVLKEYPWLSTDPFPDTSEVLKEYPWLSSDDKILLSKAMDVVRSDDSDKGEYVGITKELLEKLNTGVLDTIPKINNCYTSAMSLLESFEKAGLKDNTALALTRNHAFVAFSLDKTFNPKTTFFFDSTPESEDDFYGTYGDMLNNKNKDDFFKRILPNDNKILIDKDLSDNSQYITKNETGYTWVETGIRKKDVPLVFSESDLQVNPVIDQDPIGSLKSNLSEGASFNVDGQVTDFAEGTSTLSDGSIFSFDAFKNVTDTFKNATDSFKETSSDIIDIADIGRSTDRFPATSEVLKEYPWLSSDDKILLSKAMDVVRSDDSDEGEYIGIANTLKKLNTGVLDTIPKINNCYTSAMSLAESFEKVGLKDNTALAITDSHAFVAFSPDKTFNPKTTFFFDSSPGSEDNFYGTYEDMLNNKNNDNYLKIMFPNEDNKIMIDKNLKDNSQYITKTKNGEYGPIQTGMDKEDVSIIFSESDLQVNPIIDLGPIESLKSNLSEGASFNVDVQAPNANAVAGQLWGLGGSTTFTVYVSTVSQGYADNLVGVNYGDVIPSNLPVLQGTPNMSLYDIPAFAEGGYTGEYQGNATVHPHEVILNAAQQRGVADAIASGPRGNVTIHIDARGAIITDGSMDTLVERIKSSLQSEGYR
jgi:TP901 family phage tail tape measure protein